MGALEVVRGSGGGSGRGVIGDEVIRSFLGELPERLRPTAEAHQLQAALIWGDDQLLDVQTVTAERPLTIGQAPDAAMQVFHPATAHGLIPVVRVEPDGTFSAYLPAEARTRVVLGGEALGVVQLVERGLARPIHLPVEGVMVSFGLHDKVTLEFGNVRLVARAARPAGRMRASPFDRAFWTRLALYVMTAVTFERMVALTDWEPDDSFQPAAFTYRVR